MVSNCFFRPSTDSPTSDIETGSRGVRKRRAAMTMDSSMHERRLRNGKRSQQAIFNAPTSPAKSDVSTSSNKRRKGVQDADSETPSAKRSCNGSDNENTNPVKDENDLYECDRENCSKKYKSISALRYHQSNNHNNDDSDIKNNVKSVKTEEPDYVTPKSKSKGKSKAKKLKVKTEVVSDGDQDRSGTTTPVEGHTEPRNITYQLSAQTSNDTTIVTSHGSASNGIVVNGAAPRVATATTVNIPVATPQNGNVICVTSPTSTPTKKSKSKVEPEIRPMKSLTTLPTSLPVCLPVTLSVPVTVPASPVGIISGGASLKPIQPRPTVMGDPITSNPVIVKVKDKKIKKKKSKDKEKHVKDLKNNGHETVASPENIQKEIDEVKTTCDTVVKTEENNNISNDDTSNCNTTMPLSATTTPVTNMLYDKASEQPSSDKSKVGITNNNKSGKPPTTAKENSKLAPSPTKPLTLPSLPIGVRHDSFIRIGKFAYAADHNHHQYLMNMDESYRKQYETMLREHPHVPGNAKPQDASLPRSSSNTPTNSAKHSNITSLKPPQLISSYQSVSIPNSTKIQTVKEEPFDKSTAIKEDKSSGILYERQKEELQRFYMFQQQRLLEQKRKSEKKMSQEHKPLNLSSPSPRTEEKPISRDSIKNEKEKNTSMNLKQKEDKPDIKSPKPGETPSGIPTPYSYFYPPGPLPPQSPYASPFDPYRQPHHTTINYGTPPFSCPNDPTLVSPSHMNAKSHVEKPQGAHAALERLQKHASQYYKVTANTPIGATLPGGLTQKIHELETSDALKTPPTPPSEEKKTIEDDDKSHDASQHLHHHHTHHHTHVVRPGFPLPYEPYHGNTLIIIITHFYYIIAYLYFLS